MSTEWLNMKWLSNHWFIFGFVFATGTAYGWQQIQQQTIKEVVIKQSQQSEDLTSVKSSIQLIQLQQNQTVKTQDEIKVLINKLIDLQMGKN